ncbi:uncharacterized protein LOC111412704 [Olea europaea var. sylvestris]|uniref:uncharacterized protein LOC111412704 n=1 Tax=Olea europaea var. sylvestris TaxID=158386 RepID=UPI000C1D50D2|nr:uncharacterized protein LOC111412704 [Olea europaea var. sylvestris]
MFDQEILMNHLKGPYKGIILLATAQDANKQIYPLAWGIIDAETNRSWMWFLSNLKDLIGDSDELVFVSDRKNSIENAIAHLFPRAHHGYCVWVSARAYRYFVGQRYNILTNNNVESLNSMLRHAPSLPITCLVEHIRYTMQKWFYELRASATACSTVLSPTMENELRTTFEASTRLQAHGLTDNLTQVGISNDTDIVDFSENTCTFHEFQLNRMLCVHATRAACLRGKSLYDLCSPYYTFEYWECAYGEAIYPVLHEVDWIFPAEITGTPIYHLVYVVLQVDHPHNVSNLETSIPHGSGNALAAVDLVITRPHVRITLYHVRCKQHFVREWLKL